MVTLVRRFLIVYAGVCAAVLVAFYSFYARCAAALGRLPRFDNPDPKTFGFTTHRALTDLLTSLAVVAWPVCLVATVLLLAKRHLGLGQLLVLLLLQALVIVAVFFSPVGEWYAD
ncbi:MAG: hypothetical protein JWP58_1726 [Hymenobacter sp.]|nr:hypothetical protein [Hymenobacter sp.]